MKKHFVTFLSPGTFVAEQSTKPIGSWDTEDAMEMARDILERHGATPYGFYFTTRSRKDRERDSSVTDRSGTYYLGGKILSIEDIESRHDPKDNVLLSNMRCNGWSRVVENNNSWRWTQPLEDKDTVLSFNPTPPNNIIHPSGTQPERKDSTESAG